MSKKFAKKMHFFHFFAYQWMSKLDMDRMDDEKDSQAAKIVCACPRCVRGQGNAQKRATRKRATLNVYTTE